MPSISITVTDKQAAAILAHWETQAKWKQWVAEQTRREVLNARIRKSREDADAAYQEAVDTITADDA